MTNTRPAEITTNDDLVAAIGAVYFRLTNCSAPCNGDAVAIILAILNGAILSGDEVALEGIVHEWAVHQYPAIYAQWQGRLTEAQP